MSKMFTLNSPNKLVRVHFTPQLNGRVRVEQVNKGTAPHPDDTSDMDKDQARLLWKDLKGDGFNV